MSNWPNFFIVGASRAGTSSLYEYLKKIPGIYMSPEKEPHYFSKEWLKTNWDCKTGLLFAKIEYFFS